MKIIYLFLFNLFIYQEEYISFLRIYTTTIFISECNAHKELICIFERLTAIIHNRGLCCGEKKTQNLIVIFSVCAFWITVKGGVRLYAFTVSGYVANAHDPFTSCFRKTSLRQVSLCFLRENSRFSSRSIRIPAVSTFALFSKVTCL